MELSVQRRHGQYLFAALKAFILVNALAFTGISQSASNVEGNIYGTAPAAGTVEIKNLDTGAKLSSPVHADGTFRFPSVLPGHYRVEYKSSTGHMESQDVTVTLGQGEQVRFEVVAAPTKLDTVVVTASYSAVDTASVESATNLTHKQIEALPIGRRIDAIQLLSPDAGIGSAGLANVDGTPLVSFGGSSVLENAFFINGFNITDFRRGLGAAAVPFEFYKDIEVKTGGYSAEFGRSLGGVVNAVSKTGSNEFIAGVNFFWEPDWGRSNSPNYRAQAGTNAGQIYRDNADDFRANQEFNFYASGALVPDRLFVYGSLGGRNLQSSRVAPSLGHPEQSTQFGLLSNNPMQYAFNVLANIAPGHTLQITTFSDITKKRFTSNGYDLTTGQPFGNANPYNRLNGVGETETGGRFLIANYSGQITDWFSLSALAGRGYNMENGFNTTDTGGPCPTIRDFRGDDSSVLGCDPAGGNAVDTNQFDSRIKDTRTAARLDVIFSFSALGDHQLKVGYDYEKLKTDVHYQFTGGGTYYEYDTCQNPIDGCDLNGYNAADGTDYLLSRFETTDGTFDQYLNAFYIEDNWQITPRLMLVAGVRNDSFDQRDASNQSFIKSTNNWGPRVGFSFDTFGSGKSKIYANWGRYYMPTQTDLAVRNLAIANDVTSYFTYDSIGPDGMPVNPVNVGTDSGFVGASNEARAANLKATSQDEYILGFQMEIAPKWMAGIKGTYRVLNEALEDTCFFDAALSYGCVILNPGSSVVLDGGPYSDYDFDGVPNVGTIQASDIGIPKAKRKYYAATFSLDRKYDRKWFFSASYTWAHLYGNYEGLANSDNDQADPGISIAFDSPYLVSSGNLPNDHRHTFKLYGAYDVTDELGVGINFSAQSGSPFSAFGIIPPGTILLPSEDAATNEAVVGAFNSSYDGNFAYVNGNYSPRGVNGTLPWITSLDLSARYKPHAAPGLSIGVDIANVLNSGKAFSVDETKQQTSGPNPFYGAPRLYSYQQPRTFRMSISYEIK